MTTREQAKMNNSVPNSPTKPQPKTKVTTF